MSVLLVQDDTGTRTQAAAALRGAGHRMWAAADAAGAQWLADRHRPDVALVDGHLGGDTDGFAAAAALRASFGMAIFFIVDADHPQHRMRAYEESTHGYLVRPFSCNELVARVEAAGAEAANGVVERRPRLGLSRPLRACDVELDPCTRRAVRAGIHLALTDRQFELLAGLAAAPGRTFSKPELLERVWGCSEHDVNLGEVHVSGLRRCLEVHGPREIFTVLNRGDALVPAGRPSAAGGVPRPASERGRAWRVDRRGVAPLAAGRGVASVAVGRRAALLVVGRPGVC